MSDTDTTGAPPSDVTSPHPGRPCPGGRRRRFGLPAVMLAAVAGFACATALGAVGSVIADGGPGFFGGHCARGDKDPGAVKRHIGRGAGWALDRIDATDAQRDAVLAEVDALADDVLARRDDRDRLRDALRDALTADQVDPAELEKLRTEALSLADDASRDALPRLVRIAGTLTPEQRADLAEQARRFHR